MRGATGYKVCRDGVCITSTALGRNVTGYEDADPLGHTYEVLACYGNKCSRKVEATLVSHNPWFSNSCELDDQFTVSSGFAESILLDPEATEGFESMCYTGAAGGVVYIGLTDEDCSGTQTPSWRAGTVDEWTITEVDPYNHAGYSSSVIQDHMSHTPASKTYLTVYVAGGASVDVDVFNIKPYWIDIGVKATGGGMANIGSEEYPDWVDCSGASETGEKVSGTGGAYVPGREGDMDADGIPDFADGYNLFFDPEFESSTPEVNGTDPGLVPVSITGANLDPDMNMTIKVEYDASDPMGVTRSGTGSDLHPYVYHLPQGSLRLWISNSSSRDGRTVQEGGDFLPEGEYTVAETGTSKVYVPGRQDPVDLSRLYEEDVRQDSRYDAVRYCSSKVGPETCLAELMKDDGYGTKECVSKGDAAVQTGECYYETVGSGPRWDIADVADPNDLENNNASFWAGLWVLGTQEALQKIFAAKDHMGFVVTERHTQYVINGVRKEETTYYTNRVEVEYIQGAAGRMEYRPVDRADEYYGDSSRTGGGHRMHPKNEAGPNALAYTPIALSIAQGMGTTAKDAFGVRGKAPKESSGSVKVEVVSYVCSGDPSVRLQKQILELGVLKEPMDRIDYSHRNKGCYTGKATPWVLDDAQKEGRLVDKTAYEITIEWQMGEELRTRATTSPTKAGPDRPRDTGSGLVSQPGSCAYIPNESGETPTTWRMWPDRTRGQLLP